MTYSEIHNDVPQQGIASRNCKLLKQNPVRGQVLFGDGINEKIQRVYKTVNDRSEIGLPVGSSVLRYDT